MLIGAMGGVAVPLVGQLAACGGGGGSSPDTTPTPVVSDPPFAIAGFNINMYGRERLTATPNYEQSLDALASTGSNAVLVTTPYFQSSATSSNVGPDPSDTETDANLARLFDALRARGLTVAYKFTAIPRDGSWSGAIAPANVDAWFASYGGHVIRLAALAAQHGVRYFYLANEMQSMANPIYAAHWHNLIDEVQRVFGGKLSWNAVLNARGFPDGEAFILPVASRLDHIGLSMYEPLTSLRNPSVAQLMQAWQGNREGNDLISIVTSLHQVTGRPIVFSELCYRFVDGYNINPADWAAKPSDVLDPQEQADCYEAFMRTWVAEAKPWMLGVFWWQWAIDRLTHRLSLPIGITRRHKASQRKH